ncbi:MAG: hypothetical protein WAL94_08975 [Bacteroidales bacterium]
MKKFLAFTLVVVVGLTACNDNGKSINNKSVKNDKTVAREGGVTLLITDADLIEVDSNPRCNTAEWNFTVQDAGRYDVWLSSLTCDTSHLRFTDLVTITAGDERIEKKPVGDEIVNDKSVSQPWYRADSHMGSIFFKEPGVYQVQVISDRVMTHSTDLSKLSIDKHTLINSLILKPMVN